MKSFAIRSIKHVGKALGYGIIGGCAVLVVVFVLYLESRPDLKVWHTADLDAEFTAGDSVRSFADYLLMEKQLFDQL
ncbi:MAG: alpha/beta hydrolase, partial [Deltaproteobacteria bacterium]|nr:alpha/beta hydrolase [Deltaproteobacteria bacterium]